MWLKDDLEQLKQSWKQSPWWMRLWMVLSLFLAVSSFASLSETVANWKGFFLDAIGFYREWVSGPLQGFAMAHGAYYTPGMADLLVLHAIIYSILIRVDAITTDWRERGEKWSFWLHFLIWICCFSTLAFAGANSDASFDGWRLLLVLATAIALAMFMARHQLWARLFLIQLAIVIVAVGVLGAISSGLSVRA